MATPRPAYDWRALKRWGIGLERLPADSVIEFREPTFWEQYRWPIIGVIGPLLPANRVDHRLDRQCPGAKAG